ncbi:hypothetical protein HTG_13480 [Natrinema mahii]|nr:hypothetical protein HTG_13480 [Natrinema mahii]
MTADDPFEAVADAKDALSDDAREAAVEYQHDLGTRTTRERIDYLLDAAPFDAIGRTGDHYSNTAVSQVGGASGTEAVRPRTQLRPRPVARLRSLRAVTRTRPYSVREFRFERVDLVQKYLCDLPGR